MNGGSALRSSSISDFNSNQDKFYENENCGKAIKIDFLQLREFRRLFSEKLRKTLQNLRRRHIEVPGWVNTEQEKFINAAATGECSFQVFSELSRRNNEVWATTDYFPFRTSMDASREKRKAINCSIDVFPPRLSLRKLILRLLSEKFFEDNSSGFQLVSPPWQMLLPPRRRLISSNCRLLRQRSFEVPTNPIIGATDLCRIISWQ